MTVNYQDCCPLCQADRPAFYFADAKREYLNCGSCNLVFVPLVFHLPEADEKAEYDKHRNFADDRGYRRFLERLCQPLLDCLAPQSRGLDFGCGPGPALPSMLTERGHHVEIYDKFYARNSRALKKLYDFVTATEVFEHLARPSQTLDQLWSMIRPGGVLGIMTKLVTNRNAFATWHYKNDPTHIIFFSEETLQWLAKKWDARLERVAKDAFIFFRRDY